MQCNKIKKYCIVVLITRESKKVYCFKQMFFILCFNKARNQGIIIICSDAGFYPPPPTALQCLLTRIQRGGGCSLTKGKHCKQCHVTRITWHSQNSLQTINKEHNPAENKMGKVRAQHFSPSSSATTLIELHFRQF